MRKVRALKAVPLPLRYRPARGGGWRAGFGRPAGGVGRVVLLSASASRAVNLVEHSAVGEVGGLGLVPAAEHLVDGE
jgi:hypothetical protein